MILRVPFIKKFLGLDLYKWKDIEFIVGLAALEKTCKMLGVKMKDLNAFMAENAYDTIITLFYCSYIIACQERYKKPLYGEDQARIWYERMEQKSRDAFTESIKQLFGETEDTEEKKTLN